MKKILAISVLIWAMYHAIVLMFLTLGYRVSFSNILADQSFFIEKLGSYSYLESDGGFYPFLTALALIFALSALIYFLFNDRLDYQRLLKSISIFARGILAVMLLNVGLNHVFGLEYSVPNAAVLNTKLEDMSTYSLRYYTMGLSDNYVKFMGTMYIFAAFSMLNRRLSIYGASILLFLSAQTFFLNNSFKLGLAASSWWSSWCPMILLASQYEIWKFEKEKVPSSAIRSGEMDLLLKTLKWVLFSAALVWMISAKNRKSIEKEKTTASYFFPNKHNIYNMHRYRDSVELEYFCDVKSWDAIYQSGENLVTIVNKDNSSQTYGFSHFEDIHAIKLVPKDIGEDSLTLNYEIIKPGRYLFYGNHGEDSLRFVTEEPHSHIFDEKTNIYTRATIKNEVR